MSYTFKIGYLETKKVRNKKSGKESNAFVLRENTSWVYSQENIRHVYDSFFENNIFGENEQLVIQDGDVIESESTIRVEKDTPIKIYQIADEVKKLLCESDQNQGLEDIDYFRMISLLTELHDHCKEMKLERKGKHLVLTADFG